jgi:ankyrin repeat protein
MRSIKFSFSQTMIIVFLFILPVNLLAQDGNDLIWAVMYQDLDKVKQLVESGADINFQEESQQATALIIAVQYNFGDIVQYLIEKGADLSIRTKTGHNALMAAGNQRPDIVKFLIDEGANVDATAGDGTTSLSMAEKNDDPEMVALLK